MSRVAVTVALVALASVSVAGVGLPSATPESQGVSSHAILRWLDACEESFVTNVFRHGYMHGFVIVRHGKVIAEGSWAPQDTLNGA